MSSSEDDTPKDDVGDLAEIFDFTQRESERAERFMKTTDRIATKKYTTKCCWTGILSLLSRHNSK